MERETEDSEEDREEGCWRKVQARRLARVHVLDSEEKNPSSSKEPKKEQKTKRNCDAGECKEIPLTFCHDTGKAASYQGSKSRVGNLFKDRAKVFK